MRTWRQGVIGRVNRPGRLVGYLRCLTYPLAQVFADFDPNTGQLTGFQGLVRIRLVDFVWIDRVGDSELTAAERRLDPGAAAWAEWDEVKATP